MLYSAYINGKWLESTGGPLKSYNPATGKMVWEGKSATDEDVFQAVKAAHGALKEWSLMPIEERKAFLRRYGQELEKQKDKLAEAISIENGKPLWESKGEVATMVNKIETTIEAYEKRCQEEIQVLGEAKLITRRRPHGVFALLGPFNFPGHLTNGQIIPALLAGNTLVFKPSELTPYVGQFIVELFEKISLPKGVLNLVQGARDIGQALMQQEGIQGLIFIGSSSGGSFLASYFGKHPEKILALEMGGNNPLVVAEVEDLEAAAYLTIQSSYLTTGQRCTCARRLIVPTGLKGDRFLSTLKTMVSAISIGPYTKTPEPFMGPIISEEAAKNLLKAQENLKNLGAKSLIDMQKLGYEGNFLSPGLLDVTGLDGLEDKEHFGPLLQVIRVKDFDAAIIEANKTSFGLTAGLLSDDKKQYDKFLSQVNAGIINWNVAITGNSSIAPFGGIGKSGNHRPSGYYSVDYCCYPIASLEQAKAKLPEKLTPGLSSIDKETHEL